MAPAASEDRVGPHPSYIEVAKPYILQGRIQTCLDNLNMTEAREDAVRLQGVAWIDNVRRALQLPVRTFNTAVVYYHKFRLWHSDSEYNWADAAAAALFTACKIEDTLKKSRDILCANWNLKVPPSEHLSPDDPRFEAHSKLIIGLERLMLESASFDFRNRYPQKLMVKLAKAAGFDVKVEGRTAWDVSIDLYRTFAPLKQTTTTMAIACIEIAARLHDRDIEQLWKTPGGLLNYDRWNTSRAEIMETLLDLLDLYTHHRTSTSIGPQYPLETFINIRIALNQEASAANIPRYSLYASEQRAEANGMNKPRNGVDPTSPLTPATPLTASPGQSGQAPTSAIGVRGQNGTVRFMLDAARAADERAEVDKYHKIEEEEYEVEVPNERERPGPRSLPQETKETQELSDTKTDEKTKRKAAQMENDPSSDEDKISALYHKERSRAVEEGRHDSMCRSGSNRSVGRSPRRIVPSGNDRGARTDRENARRLFGDLIKPGHGSSRRGSKGK